MGRGQGTATGVVCRRGVQAWCAGVASMRGMHGGRRRWHGPAAFWAVPGRCTSLVAGGEPGTARKAAVALWGRSVIGTAMGRRAVAGGKRASIASETPLSVPRLVPDNGYERGSDGEMAWSLRGGVGLGRGRPVRAPALQTDLHSPAVLGGLSLAVEMLVAIDCRPAWPAGAVMVGHIVATRLTHSLRAYLVCSGGSPDGHELATGRPCRATPNRHGRIREHAPTRISSA